MTTRRDSTLGALLRGWLRDPDVGWSVGAPGAIAEFLRSAREDPGPVDAGPALVAITARGALRVTVAPGVRARAWERPSRRRGAWTHGVALCLPAARAAVVARDVLTELGADRDAVRGEDAGDLLFDLGLDLPHVEACVRTSDAALVKVLRAACGRPLLGAPGVVEALRAASPHRVFASRLARIEVYADIPQARTPSGPHTHLLPALLAARRMHAAGVPVPRGMRVGLEAYPPHPARAADGSTREFDARRHEAFEALLARFGARRHVAAKARARAWLGAGDPPAALPAAGGALEEAAYRVAFAQARAAGGPAGRIDAGLTRLGT